MTLYFIFWYLVWYSLLTGNIHYLSWLLSTSLASYLELHSKPCQKGKSIHPIHISLIVISIFKKAFHYSSCSAESVKESSCRFIRSSSSFCRKHMENPPVSPENLAFVRKYLKVQLPVLKLSKEIRINGELMKDHDIEPPSQIETFFVRQKYIIQTSPTSPQRSLNGSQVNALNQAIFFDNS